MLINLTCFIAGVLTTFVFAILYSSHDIEDDMGKHNDYDYR